MTSHPQVKARILARQEDVQFMADTGASLEEAAQRIGTTEAALERGLYRHNLPNIANLLRSRNPCESRTLQPV